MTDQKTVMLQGVQVPAQSVDDALFFALTQRKQAKNKGGPLSLGQSEPVKIRQQGIIAGIEVHLFGTVVLNATPSVTPTFRWPLDILKKLRLNVNGSANLINCSGAKLKVRAVAEPDFDDRGVVKNLSNPSAAGTNNQGTLMLNGEDQGTSGANKLIPGQAQTVAGTYTVDLYYFVPVAADQITLKGSVFAQTAATEINMEMDVASQAELFSTVTSLGAITLSYDAQPVIYSIPVVNGMQIVPMLDEFHSLIESRSNVLAVGDNDIPLIGFGAGRKLLRSFWQVWNGAAPQVPLLANAVNFGPIAWLYGLNERPEVIPNGTHARYQIDRLWNCDIAAIWGFLAYDFANKFALRDLVDGNKVTDLRLNVNIASGVSPALNNATAEFVQEALSVAPISA